jgi:hypothetical protein
MKRRYWILLWVIGLLSAVAALVIACQLQTIWLGGASC